MSKKELNTLSKSRAKKKLQIYGVIVVLITLFSVLLQFPMDIHPAQVRDLRFILKILTLPVAFLFDLKLGSNMGMKLPGLLILNFLIVSLPVLSLYIFGNWRNRYTHILFNFLLYGMALIYIFLVGSFVFAFA